MKINSRTFSPKGRDELLGEVRLFAVDNRQAGPGFHRIPDARQGLRGIFQRVIAKREEDKIGDRHTVLRNVLLDQLDVEPLAPREVDGASKHAGRKFDPDHAAVAANGAAQMRKISSSAATEFDRRIAL